MDRKENYDMSRSIRVLAVDDEPSNLAVIEGGLRPLGLEIVRATDADEARQALGAGPFHLVLLDVMLPGQSGIELCRAWRREELLARTPIVLVTALGADTHRAEGLQAGADDFIEKPIDLDSLTRRVRSWLALGRSPRLTTSGQPAGPMTERLLAMAREIVPEATAVQLARDMARAAGLDARR